MPTLELIESKPKKPTLELVDEQPLVSLSPAPVIDYNSVLDFSFQYELPPEDVEGIYGPLNTMTRAVTDPQEMDFGLSTLPPQENLKIGEPTGKEKKTFLESILGFTYPAHPPGWEYASPIEKFNFATLPIADFLGRAGGKMANDWRLSTKEETQKILVSEYHDTLKWYQKSPEVAGWSAEKICEYAALKFVFAVSGLSNVLTGAGQKISQPFVSKAISAGGPELKTLSGAGIRNLLRQGLVNFLQAAPENTTFVSSWSGLDSVLKGNPPKQIALDAAKGGGWALGLTAGLGFLAPLTKTPEVQGAFQRSAAYLARKYPRTIDFISKDIEPEIIDRTVKLYGEHIGQDIRFTELPANVQAGVRNAARALKKELIKAAQKEEALKTYLSAKLTREAREAGAIIPGFISEEARPFGEAIKEAPVVIAPVAEAIITPPPITPEQEVFNRIESPTGKVKLPPTIAAKPPVEAVAAITPAEPIGTAPKQSEVLYHASKGKLDLAKKFDVSDYPDGLDLMDYMGVHLGTKKAAIQRTKSDLFEGEKTKITPFVADIKKPFGDKIWQEDELRPVIKEYGQRQGITSDKNTAIRAKQEMQKEGYDGILYYNSEEDPGSISKIVFSKEQLAPLSGEAPAGAPEEKGQIVRLNVIHKQTALGVQAPYHLPEGEYRFRATEKVSKKGTPTVSLQPIDKTGKPIKLTNVAGQTVDIIELWKRTLDKLPSEFTLEAKQAPAVAPEEAILKPTRKALVELEQEIQKSDIYQMAMEGQAVSLDEIGGGGIYYVPEKFRGEVENAIQNHPALRFHISYDPTGTKGTPYDTTLAEALEKKTGGIGGEIGIDEFLDRLGTSIEATQKVGKLNAKALESMVTSKDPYNMILAAKYEMMKLGFPPDQINGIVREIAIDAEIPEEYVKPLLVKEEQYVISKKQKVVKGMAKEIRPTEKVRPKDLIGRPVLEGGAVGKQGEFLEKEQYRLPEPDIEGQMKMPSMKPGFVELPPQLQDIADSVKENVQAIAKDIGDLVKSLEFYPDLPNDLRNDIRVDVVGAIDRARDDVYDKIANYLWGKMKNDDVQKSVEIIFARDQVSRTQLGKGNPEIGLEDAYAFLDMAMEDASPEVIAAADRWRTINQKFRDKLIERGLLDKEQLIEDYAPHYVLDYTPDWKFNVGIPTRLKRPFRGYIKKAHGTKKEYQQDKDALLGSLLIQQHDNIIEDFIKKQCEKYNILTTLSKEQKKELFGTDEAGKTRPPKPGRIVVIENKRYRAYTPDIPFTRQLFPTEEGLMALGRYKNVSLIPENIYNLFKEFSERGSRSVYLINRATSIWKSMAILSHFPSFNINNIVGDTWMAMVQHPDPLKLVTEISTAIQYVSGRGTGPYFERLHKFIVEQNILSGTFAASEMAQMRSSGNPIAWLLEKTQEFSNAREAITRTAYASTLLKAQEAGEAVDMIKAHDWIDTEDLAEDAALGKIAREVLVDYQATSKTFKRFIRGAVAPFATWYVKGSKLMWSWAAKHWGKALAVFMGVPIAAEVYNHRTDEINELEKQLPDYVRNRTHLVLGENADGTIRVWSFQFPQDALIGTKIFSILTDYANRVYNKEMTVKEAALQCLRIWGIKEAKGLAFLTAPLIRYFGGLMTPNHRDPYDGAPIYTTDPAKMTWFDRKKDESLFFLKTMVPFLSVSIGAYEKGQPTDIALKNLLDRFAGKGALGIYDVNKQGNLIIERNGQKFEFDYDDVARIQYIVAKEERYLDKIERSFIGSGLSPDKFVDTSLCYNQLDKIYDLWSKFEPSLEKEQWVSPQEKARAMMGKLGERFTNRLVDMSVIKKWYNVKLARADTDAEKITLREELKIVQSVQMIETLKKLPRTARTIGLNTIFQKSELPWELILTLP
jgi:hypothetical protein